MIVGSRAPVFALAMSVIVLLLSLIPVPASSSETQSVFLTRSNYNSLTENKAVFIKWAAPWCSHSQDLAPAWDQLLTAISASGSSSTVLIAEVDCAAQEAWCVEMGYTAYPTLTYGDPSMGGIFLQLYVSLAKTADDLIGFVRDKLMDTPFCTPGNLGACSEPVRERLRAYMDMTANELQASIEREEELIKMAVNSFEKVASGLQVEYNQLAKEQKTKMAKTRRHIKLIKAVHKSTTIERSK